MLLALWLGRIRKTDFWQLCVFAAAMGSAFILIFWLPYTWNGAGGPIGNRYFLSIYPLLLFLLPKETGAWTAIASGIGGIAFLWPVFGHPFLAAREPWRHPATVPLRFLPVERTAMNEIPERLNPERYKIPFPEGAGFWIAGDASTEVVVAIGSPAAHLRLTVASDIANTFTANWGGSKCHLEFKAHEAATCELETSDSVWAHGSYFYSLKMSAKEAFVPPAPDSRKNLGVKVIPIFSEK